MQKLSTNLCVFLTLLTAAQIASGQLLVSDRTTGQITQYNAQTGDFQKVLVDGDFQTNGGLLAPTSMALGPNGDLYVASLLGLNPEGTGSVLRYDSSNGEFLGVFADGLPGPSGLHYNAERDEMYVSTFGNFDSELVFRYQASTGELLSTLGEGTGMSGRTTIDFGPDGDLYVASFANGEFFTGGILKFDGETQAPLGMFALEPFLAGANSFTFREAEAENTFQLDLVGLFSNNVARFDVALGDEGLSVTDQRVLIPGDAGSLDFPSALMDLGDGSMIVTNLGNDNPQTGPLRAGSIARFDIATGEFLNTFVEAGGDGSLAQPTSLLLLPSDPGFCADGIEGRDGILSERNLILGDFDANGEVGFLDFLILSEHFGFAGGYADGDADCNGQVEFADFLVFSANFGQSSAEAAAVPEPSGFALFSLAMLGLVARRRRRNS